MLCLRPAVLTLQGDAVQRTEGGGIFYGRDLLCERGHTKAIAENEAGCGMHGSLTHFNAAEQQSLSLGTGYFQGKEKGLIQIFLGCLLPKSLCKLGRH